VWLEAQKDYFCIGDVRGSGLFLGIEIVKDEDSLEPDTVLANYIKNELRNKNILISTDGPFDSVIKSKPPLCFTKENAQEVIEHTYEILKNYYKQRGKEK
jgi:4-aminobutyrate aminotransferase-like enzyme